MTPTERIADTDRIDCELRYEVPPWFTSSWRMQQWQQNFSAGQFSWFVSETRRVGGGADLWSIIADQLRDWEPPQIAN
jgi:hypothetical protein